MTTKRVDGRGVEISQHNVNACVARGLSVMQGDADTDLSEYPSQVFDVAILSQTIQATRNPRKVLERVCCASAGAASCRCRISDIGACGSAWA